MVLAFVAMLLGNRRAWLLGDAWLAVMIGAEKAIAFGVPAVHRRRRAEVGARRGDLKALAAARPSRPPMTVRLRAHHLLCLLTYVGKGYSPAFTANYDAIAGRLAGARRFSSSTVPTTSARRCSAEPEPHCLSESVIEREQARGGGCGGARWASRSKWGSRSHSIPPPLPDYALRFRPDRCGALSVRGASGRSFALRLQPAADAEARR